ncbi:TraR/DksA C4-type zinc finger protein [Orbaceae bacterium ac157xtp]
MDNADLAAKVEIETRERALANHQTKTGVSSLNCCICDEPIPEVRRRLLTTDLCVDCALIEEKKLKI